VVGSNSSGQTTNFTSGTNNYSNGYVGYNTGDSNNTLTLSTNTGTGTLLVITNTLYVGSQGSSNSLSISAGATVSDGTGTIGDSNTSSNNSALVTGTNSLWTNSIALVVGYSGSGNSLIISNGATVADVTGWLGVNSTSSNNVAVVTGTNSLWTNSGDLTVGNYGASNSLTISSGAKVADGNAWIGYYSTSSNNSVLVTGTNSLWSNSIALVVGYSGSATLSVANGGSVAASTGITLASQAGSSGTLNIGSLGGSDTAGILTTPTIAFGAGTGVINFNQINTATLTSSLSGAGTVNQLGSGTTILSGNNSYTGTTTINAGTLQASSANALGTSAVVLNGGTLRVNSLLTINTLNWASTNAVIAISGLGANFLTVTNAITLSATNGNTFNLSGDSVSSTPQELLSFGTNLLTSSDFGVTGLTGYNSLTLSVSNNALWTTGVLTPITPITDLIASPTTTIVNGSSSYGSLLFQSNGILNITPSGNLTISNSVIVNNNGLLILNGLLNTPLVTITQGALLTGSGTLNGT
jgi:T5SS/PEP-CTERM-associated repeat protein